MKQLTIILGLLACVVAYGCKSSNPVTASTQTGDLTGRMALIDTTQRYVQDRSGVIVQVEGTLFSAVSDTAGYWTIKNLPSATYSISFSKPGYSTWKNTSFEFVGGGLTWFGDYFPSNGSEVTLQQPPTFLINLDSIQKAGSSYLQQYDSMNYIEKFDTIAKDSIVFKGRDTVHHVAYRLVRNSEGTLFAHLNSVTLPPNQRYARFLAGTNPNPDILDPTTFTGYIDLQLANQNIGKTILDLAIAFTSNFYGFNFSSGQTIYIRAYPINQEGLGGYYDVGSRKKIITGYGTASNILKFTY